MDNTSLISPTDCLCPSSYRRRPDTLLRRIHNSQVDIICTEMDSLEFIFFAIIYFGLPNAFISNACHHGILR